jgi:hypothetical protein
LNGATNRGRWICLDCGKDTFENKEDYYFLRNHLWRSLVRKDEQHGMICRSCIERRLGRPLAPDDFRSNEAEQSDPEDRPMEREDYGIIDLLTPPILHAIDSAMIEFASLRPRRVTAIVRYMFEDSSAAIPGLPDWFYMDRIGELIEGRALVVVRKGEDLRFDVVMAAGLPDIH